MGDVGQGPQGPAAFQKRSLLGTCTSGAERKESKDFSGLYRVSTQTHLVLKPPSPLTQQVPQPVWQEVSAFAMESENEVIDISFQKQNTEIWNLVAQLLSPIQRRAQIQIHLQNRCFLFSQVCMLFEPNI